MIFYIILILTILLYLWYRKRCYRMTQLKRNGIPGPEPHLIFGNFKEYAAKGYKKCHDEWIEKYGRIVGYYLGGKPFVLIADPELLKLIQIKDFHNFVKRPFTVDGGINPNPRLQNNLVIADGTEWKHMRSILTPTFSGAKLKQMTPILDSSIDQMISLIDKKAKNDEEFDIYLLLQGLTMDTIAKTAFGVDTDVQNNPNDPFLDAARRTFSISTKQILILLWFFFPELRFIINPIRRITEIIWERLGLSPHGYLLETCDRVIEQRRKNPAYKRKDLLNLMLDTQSIGELSSEDLEISTDMSKDKSVDSGVTDSDKKGYRMTDDSVASNSVLFFDAGYETTSTALSYVMHILVNKQDVQKKMREEVKHLYEDDGRLDYNSVTKLPYMESVVYETMRLYPPVTTFISRAPNIDYHYGDIVIPRGTDCRVPLYYLHHDPELWDNPEMFDAERFSKEKRHMINSVIWQPFGVGPRNCIGMRFALLEIKLLLSKLLLKYQFIPGKRTEIGDITREFKIITMSPKYGIFLKAIPIK